MSAIASATAASQTHSPLSRLKTELASEVSAGTISSADQSALSDALDSIDSAMQASRPEKGSRPPSPDEMQSKIDSLIGDQVSSGALTSDQAEELKTVFANTFAQGPGGPGGAGGPPPGPPPGESDDGSSSSSSTSSSNSDLAKLLTDFLQSLKDSKSSSTGYGASGDQLSSQLRSLILDYSA